MSDKKLFSEFNPTGTEAWEEKILTDLKGADYAKRLITKTIEGIDIKPYYRKEDLQNLDHLMMNPGEFPFVRTNNSADNFSEIRQDIQVNSFAEAGKEAINAVNKGVSSVAFNLSNKQDISYEEFTLLVDSIDIEAIEINFLNGYVSQKVLSHILKYIDEKGLDSNKIRGSVDYDPLGNKTITGKCHSHKNGDCKFSDMFVNLLNLTEKSLPKFAVLTVNAHHFRNSGSSAVQEVAFAVAMGSDYLDKAQKAAVDIDKTASKMKFSFGISSDYFMEIAKIRAARLVWAKIVEAYGVKDKRSCDMYIHSSNCDWNKTAYDPYVNVLRSTTEAMSAVLGGTDSLTVKPFDQSFEKPDEFSKRIARNIQIILRDEAYFDKAVDPSGGSYFIENLTNGIAEHAWELFQEIENEGGYHIALDKGIIKSKVDDIAQKRDMNIAQRREILLGTNQYPNRNETVAIEFNDDEQINKNALKIYRGAQAFEKLRQASEKHVKQPVVFLLTMGNFAMRKARATFSGNFFACAGYKIIESEGFETTDEAAQASIDAHADITVICSSDDEYPDIAPCIYEKLKDKSIVVIAGYPKNSIEALKAFGIKHFIHMRSNVLESLQAFHKEIGIE